MFTKNNFLYLLFAITPVLLLILGGFFIIPKKADYTREILNFVLVSSFLYGICFLLPFTKIKAVFSFLVGFLLSALLLIKLNFYYLYKAKLSASALFVIFETNAQETQEFLSVYIGKLFIGLSTLLILYLLLYAFILFRKKIIFRLNGKNWLIFVSKICFAGIVLLSAFLIHKKFAEYNLLYKTKSSFTDYKIAKNLIKKNLAKPTSSFLKEVKKDSTAPKTVVIVIGESTNRNHMSLYGYYRNTNPLLSKQTNLLVFKDVITPHVHTINAMDKIFTLNSFTNEDLKNNASIIQLANQAGYKTFWLSNQRPVGINESIPTLIGYAANKKKFLNTDNYNRQSYDEVLLPEFEQALKDHAPYKMIFLHLSGTHLGYAERYPENYNNFTDIPKTNYKHDKAYKLINQYDNAVLYNDFVVNQLLLKLKKNKEASSFIYFSDHGDDVFDDHDNAGHSESIGTKGMFEIPFLVWLSPKIKKQMPPLESFTERKYLMDDFIHSFADLNQIHFEDYQASKSIFNKKFIQKPRIIKNQENYDEEE